MTDKENTDLQAVIDAARETAKPTVVADPGEPLIFVVPEGARLEVPDLSKYQAVPSRMTGIYRPATVEAFTEFVGRFLSDATTVWVHPTSGRVVAVIDDNSPETGGFGQHRAELNLATTPEWDYWTERDGDMMSQTDFAEHVEGGLDEIEEPDAATVLEIAQSFHATSSAAFRSSTRLQSGEQRLQYDESIDAKAGASGDLTVPTMILLGISPFIGEDRYKLAARFRFRLAAGKLTLGYKLDRPDRVKRDAIEQIAERLSGAFPRVYIGEPA